MTRVKQIEARGTDAMHYRTIGCSKSLQTLIENAFQNEWCMLLVLLRGVSSHVCSALVTDLGVQACSVWQQMWVRGQWPKCFNQTLRREWKNTSLKRLVHTSLTTVICSNRPVLVRFSTVIHPAGSPETLRDPRGFAVKLWVICCCFVTCFCSTHAAVLNASPFIAQLHNRRQLRSCRQQSSSVLHSWWTQVPWHGSCFQAQSRTFWISCE